MVVFEVKSATQKELKEGFLVSFILFLGKELSLNPVGFVIMSDGSRRQSSCCFSEEIRSAFLSEKLVVFLF